MSSACTQSRANFVQPLQFHHLFSARFHFGCCTAIGTKFAPPYSILFMADLEKRLLSDIYLKPYIRWRYIDDTFLILEYSEESLKLFLEKISSIHPTIKFTADWLIARLIFQM